MEELTWSIESWNDITVIEDFIYYYYWLNFI